RGSVLGFCVSAIPRYPTWLLCGALHGSWFGDARRTQAEAPDWFGWHRLGGMLKLRGGHAFRHLWARYGKDHPDWVALQPAGSRGQSQNPDRARLCVSNPDLIAAIAREKIEELNNNSNLLGISIAPNNRGRPTF